MAGNLKPGISRSDVFSVNYFLHRTIKVAKELPMFLASLPDDSHFVPHHITDQCLVMRLKGSIEKWQPKLDCHQFRESTEGSLVLINLCHVETWKGTGILSAQYCWDVHVQRTGFWSTSRLLLADPLTEHLFMPLGLAKHYMVLPYH